MPQVNINVSKPLNNDIKNKLQLEIGNIMEIIPGKNIGNTIICITDCCSVYKNGEAVEGAFIEVRLYKASPEESKKEFAEKMFAIFKDVLGIQPEFIYMNYLELPNWAANGSYF